MSSPGFPFTTPPIPDGVAASAPRWWQKFIGYVSTALDQVVGTGSDSGWITPTFQNSWVNFTTSGNPAGYRLLHGRVWLRGLIKLGAVGTIFQLPVGYQALNAAIFSQVCSSSTGHIGIARVTVNANGSVALTTYAANGTNGFVSLEGISFVQGN